MKKDKVLAVIDIGAHAIKMHIGEIGRNKNIRKVEYLWVPVAIGKDAFSKGQISNQTINETIKVIQNFKEVILSYNIKRYRAIATSSIREAGNADVLIERVFKSTGIRIGIIEPLEEMEIIYLGLRNILKKKFSLEDKNMLFFSLGGGSSQILLQSKGKIVFSETQHIGTLKISRDFDFNDRSYQFRLHPFAVNFENTVKRYADIHKMNGFVAVNDDVLTVIQKAFPDYLTKEVFRIPRKEFNRLYGQIDKMPLGKMQESYQLNDNVLKTTKIAMLLFGLFYGMTSASRIIIPNISTSYFMLYQLAFLDRKNTGIGPEQHDNILSSAMALGKKYQYDKEHAQQVLKLSLLMFQKLQAVYGFSARDKIYLEVAAILHDIGSFVSSIDHNKQSMQLIMSSEIMGLQKTDLDIISQIARYHRKSPPKPSHSLYNALTMEDRLTVSRLSAILRIADAMDNTHTQTVEDIDLAVDEEKCEIRLKIKNGHYEYLDIIRSAVAKKSDLFESFFGIPVKVEKTA